ncbi:MAG: hypothetical protein ACP5VE_09075 [Chthonomonadales bacterium]
MMSRTIRSAFGPARRAIVVAGVSALLGLCWSMWVWPQRIPPAGSTARRTAAPRHRSNPAIQAKRIAFIRPRGRAPESEWAYFRLSFSLRSAPTLARLTLWCASLCRVYVNGYRAWAGDAAEPQVLYITHRLAQGANVLAIACRTLPSWNGLAFDLRLRDGEGRIHHLVSGRSVRASGRFFQRWQQPDFDDSAWLRATVERVAEERAAPRPITVRGPSLTTGPASTALHRAEEARSRAVPAPLEPVDYGRIIRVWNLGRGSLGDLYTRERLPGERMLLTTSVGSQAEMAAAISAGFTLFQTDSDHLSTEQVAPGVWDYHRPDGDLMRVNHLGMDWCYFPHFAFPPKWYRDAVPFTRITCMEHNKPVQAFSPWEPKFATSVSVGYRELAKHYASFKHGPRALYLGVHGDYGECGLLMGARIASPEQRQDWLKRFGDLHDHLGWWCADPLAVAAFRTAMLRKYGDLDVLNAAWHTRFRTPDEITYPADPHARSRRAWLDFAHWYLDSVSALTDLVCRVARSRFPNTLLMLPVGFGDENPRGGNDNSMIPKIAARYKVDVRSTHGGFKPFPQNQASMLGRIATACRFYGVPFWTEPPSAITPEGELGRIFEAVSEGSKGFFDWGANVLRNRDVYYRYGKYLRVEKPIVDVAMFYPTTTHLLQPDIGYPQMLQQGAAALRDVLNFDTVDERLIQDGALDRYRILVLWEGTVVEASTLEKIRDWVTRGGVLVAYDFGKIETVEGDRRWFMDLFGYAGKLNPAVAGRRYVSPSGDAAPQRYRVSVGQPSAAPFLSGEWYDPEASGGSVRRWTGESAELIVPATPGSSCMLEIRASFPEEAASLKHEVLVNGVAVGVLNEPGEHTYRFEIPPNLLKSDTAVITLRSDTFVPADLMPQSSDRRKLGVWVTYVQVEPAGSAEASPAEPLTGHIEAVIDFRRLRTEWARPYGKGWTVYYPATRRSIQGFYEVVRYLTYHLSDLDPTKHDALPVDDAWDGVYGTLLSTGMLYYNPTMQTVTRNIVLPPAAFEGYPDVEKPDRFNFTVTLDPQSITFVPFKAPVQELLLQCEKFTQLGNLHPETGREFSPPDAPNAVHIPAGAEVGTRFQCEVPGRYAVFYRVLHRGILARAEVSVDGVRLRPSPPSAGPHARAATEEAGWVTLAAGIHSLTVKAPRNEDVDADFVILCTDPAVSGYAFAPALPAP